MSNTLLTSAIKSTNVRILMASLLLAAAVPDPVAADEGRSANTAQVERLLNDGSDLVQRGRWPDAERTFAKAVRIAPDLALAHYDHGVALAMLGRRDAAIAEYREAIRCNPAFGEALVNLGVELSKQGRFSAAVGPLSEAVRVAPDLAPAHHNLGSVLAALDRVEEAIAVLERAVALAPADHAIRRTLAETYYNAAVQLSAERRWPEALTRYRAALRADAEMPEGFNGLGVALAHLDGHAASIDMYREALRLRPSFAEASYNLAVSQAALGRYADAIASCRAALATRPTLSRARVLLDVLQRVATPLHMRSRLSP
jgi:tetratricopeptide (TPR) repeat protein